MDIDSASTLLQEFFAQAGFRQVQITVLPIVEGEYQVNLAPTPEDAPMLIGKNGDVLAALQHLLKMMFRQKELLKEGERLRIDVDSYRQNQEKRVLDIADKRAKLVLDTGRQEMLPPMSAFFRRLVHLHVKDKYPQLITFSQGDGTYRSVCIASSSMVPEENPADLYMNIDM